MSEGRPDVSEPTRHETNTRSVDYTYWSRKRFEQFLRGEGWGPTKEEQTLWGLYMLGQSIKDGYWNNPRGHKQEPEPQKLNGLGIFSKSEMQDVQKVVDLQSAGTPESEAALKDFLATKDYRFFAEYNLWAALHNQNTGRSDIHGLGWQPPKYVSPANRASAAPASEQPPQHATVVYTSPELHPWLHPPPDPPDAQLNETPRPTYGEYVDQHGTFLDKFGMGYRESLQSIWNIGESTANLAQGKDLAPSRPADTILDSYIGAAVQGVSNAAAHDAPLYSSLQSEMAHANAHTANKSWERIMGELTAEGLFFLATLGTVPAAKYGAKAVTGLAHTTKNEKIVQAIAKATHEGGIVDNLGTATRAATAPIIMWRWNPAAGWINYLKTGPVRKIVSQAEHAAKETVDKGKVKIQQLSDDHYIITRGTESQPAKVPATLVDLSKSGKVQNIKAAADDVKPDSIRIMGDVDEVHQARFGLEQTAKNTYKQTGKLTDEQWQTIQKIQNDEAWAKPPGSSANQNVKAVLKETADIDSYSTQAVKDLVKANRGNKFPNKPPPKTVERVYETEIQGIRNPKGANPTDHADGLLGFNRLPLGSRNFDRLLEMYGLSPPKADTARPWKPMRPWHFGDAKAQPKGAAGGKGRAEALSESKEAAKTTIDKLVDDFARAAREYRNDAWLPPVSAAVPGAALFLRFPPGVAAPGLDAGLATVPIESVTPIDTQMPALGEFLGSAQDSATGTSVGSGLDTGLRQPASQLHHTRQKQGETARQKGGQGASRNPQDAAAAAMTAILQDTTVDVVYRIPTGRVSQQQVETAKTVLPEPLVPPPPPKMRMPPMTPDWVSTTWWEEEERPKRRKKAKGGFRGWVVPDEPFVPFVLGEAYVGRTAKVYKKADRKAREYKRSRQS